MDPVPVNHLTGRIVLGPNRYGKAENRVVRIYRDTVRHEIRDLNVTSSLRGDFDAAHVTGDQHAVLPTDSQKQTIFAYAATHLRGSVEDYGLALARHFVDDIGPVSSARIEIEDFPWERVGDHPHTWTRKARRCVPPRSPSPVPGAPPGMGRRGAEGSGGPQVHRLRVLRVPRGSVHGARTHRRSRSRDQSRRPVAVRAHRRDWDRTYAGVRAVMLDRFANLQSKALQQTLFEMGRAVLEAFPYLAEIRLQAPNKHHFLYDLDAFGIPNRGEVFHADDRPYGLMHVTVQREDAPEAGIAWDEYTGRA